jgi:hypothetical protein
MTRKLLLLAAALVAAAPAHATKYAAEFLRIPVGARAVGMGGAFTAVADDATASWWNPAGMVYLPYKEVIPQHQEKFGSLANHDFIGAVLPLDGAKGHRQAVGVGLLRFGVDDIPITPRPSGLVAGRDFIDSGTDGDPDTRDANGTQGDGLWEPGERLLISSDNLFMASSADIAVLLSYARQKSEHWAFGGNLKFVRQSIPDTLPGEHVTSFGAGLDAGALYMPTDAVTVGATLKDLTTTYLAWSNGSREKVDPSLDLGVALNFKPAARHALTWAMDLDWDFDNRRLDSELHLGRVTGDLHTGLEYWYRNLLALRSGVSGKDLAFGAGLRYKQIGVDYAASLHRFLAKDDAQFPDDRNLDATHLVSASFAW